MLSTILIISTIGVIMGRKVVKIYKPAQIIFTYYLYTIHCISTMEVKKAGSEDMDNYTSINNPIPKNM